MFYFFISLLLTQLTFAEQPEELQEYIIKDDKEINTLNNNPENITNVTAKAKDKTKRNWYPVIHLTEKSSDDRQLGRFDLMNPLWQSSNSMFFSDIRCTFDDEDSIEGNIGTGFRRIVHGTTESKDWIWGIYGFYDIRKSPNGNKFNQGTLGIELLKTNIELRGNIYIPENKKYVIASKTVNSVSLSGTSIIQHTQSLTAFERALPGYDVEVGYGLDIGKTNKLWIHSGYFNFDHSDSPKIAGHRFRLNYEINDSFGIDGSQLNIGVEFQHDKIRNNSTFACISLSIPFGGHPKYKEKKRNIRNRMMRQIVRDVDVVTSADNINLSPGSTGGPKIISNTEAPVIDSASGEQIDMYFVSADGSSAGLGTQENPMTIVQAETASMASDILFLINDDGGIDVNTISSGTLTLKPYQQILGIGDNTSKDIQLPNDLTLTVNSNTGRPSLTHSGDTDTVKMVFNNTIEGITISEGNNGISGQNVDNPVIRDVTIQNVNNNAVNLTNSSGTVTISESNFQNNNLDAIYLNNYAGGNTDVSILNNNISDNISRGINVNNTNGSTITGDIQNNTISGNGTQGIYIQHSKQHCRDWYH